MGASKFRYGVHRLRNGELFYIPYVDNTVFDVGLKMPSNWGDIDVHDIDSAQKYPLGTQLRRGTRVWAYAEFGGVTAAGDVVQSEGPDAVHDALAPEVTLAGATEFLVTSPASGSADFIKDEYAGGFVIAQVNGSPGYSYGIATQAALDISETATMKVVLNPGENLAVALAITDDLAFIKNPWKEIIEMPATLTGAVAGISMAIQADGQFGWVGIQGPHAVLTSGTVFIGQPVSVSDTTAGAVEPWLIADSSAVELAFVGTVRDIGGDGEFSLIDVNIGLVSI